MSDVKGKAHLENLNHILVGIFVCGVLYVLTHRKQNKKTPQTDDK